MPVELLMLISRKASQMESDHLMTTAGETFDCLLPLQQNNFPRHKMLPGVKKVTALKQERYINVLLLIIFFITK